MPGKDRDDASIFNVAREFDSPDAREDYLRGACGGDHALYDRIAALLRAHDQQPEFLEWPPARPVATVDLAIAMAPAGTQIGPYKLLEQIGEGGLGVVYLAEQQEPVRRRVAIKLIKPGMDSREIVRRFQAERQALALMDHPNIAKVLDAGTTDTGHPYFVMELIKGVAITTYCQQCQFTTRQRLELFVTFCHAVQHAHQKGIVHRDIKPSNVLIAMQDGQPTPKVIDFGVAKAINHRLTDETLHTQFAHMIGTPLYMSPEQAKMSQLDIDTRSDVYSLGVLLYELLTGTTPFTSERLKEASYDEVRRIICEEDPPKPSSRISTEGHLASTIARERRTDCRGLSRMICGDLDWIVMKAMEKDRGRRYQTASALADDVERYLADVVIEARPPSAIYQFSKFYRRNRLALSTAAIVLVAAMAGVAVSTTLIAAERNAAQAAAARERLAAEEADRQRAEAERQQRLAQVKAAEADRQRRRAEENLQQARDAVDRWLTRASDQLANTPHTTRIREALLTDALEFYQGFLDQKSDDPVIRRETGFAYLRVSEVLQELGRHAERIEPAQQAVAIFEGLAAEFKDSPRYRELLADAYGRLASAFFFTSLSGEATGNQAVKAGRKALRLYEQLIEDFPDEPRYRRTLALHCTNFGNQLQHQEKHAEAEQYFRRAIDEWQSFREDFPDVPVHDESLAHAHHWLGSELVRQGRLAEAETHLRRSLGLRERIVANTDANLPNPRHQLGHVQHYLAKLLLNQGRLREAEELARASMKIFAELDKLYPDKADYRKRYYWGLDQLSSVLHAMQRYDEAEAILVRVHELRRAMLAAEGNAKLFGYAQGWTAYNLGLLHHRLGHIRDAAARFREAFAHFEQALNEQPRMFKFQNAMRWVLLTCPLEQFRDPQRALALSRQLLQQRPESAGAWNGMGLAHYRAGDWNAAIEAFEKSIALSGGGSSFDFYPLAMAHWQLGDKQKARHWYDRGIQHKENSRGSQNPDLVNLRAETAALLGIDEPDGDADQGDPESEQNESE